MQEHGSPKATSFHPERDVHANEIGGRLDGGRLDVKKRRFRRKGSAALAHVRPVLAASTAGLPPPDVGVLIERIGRFAWHESMIRLAVLGSVVANHGGPDGDLARELTVDLFLGADPAQMTPRGRVLWAHLSRLPKVPPIANEAAIYFVQALALLHGRDDGPAPTEGAIAELLVAANDCAFGWLTEDARPLTTRERTVADTTRALTFNRGDDPAREIVRSYQMLQHRPVRRALWKTDGEWLDLQRRAFGVPLDEYLEAYVMPLVTLSRSWGQRGEHGLEAPILDPVSWWQKTLVDPASGEKFLRNLSMTHDEARAELTKRVRADGVVVGSTVFYQKPFVELPDRRLIALSPGLVREHLRGGLWGRHRGATLPSSEWPPAFGELFEDWCQHVANIAAVRSVDQIIIPASRGTDDEVEDVIIRKNDKAVFVSVKASTIPEATMRGAHSRQRALEWFEKFLFVERGTTGDGHEHGGGALRRLDAKIAKLRAGHYEGRGLPRGLKVFPLVVCYEHGFDSPAVYAWCEDRCAELSLLTQSRVAPVTFASVEDFEALMALGTRGHSAIDILREKTGGNWKCGRFDVLLHGRKREDLALRLPELTTEFDAIMARSSMRVFGRRPE